jgi:hypothetical protein
MTSGVLGPLTWETEKTIDCIFWRGGISNSLVSEKFKSDVSGVILLRPGDFERTDIQKNTRIQLTSDGEVIGYFSAFYADDIGQQGQVIMLPIKEIV